MTQQMMPVKREYLGEHIYQLVYFAPEMIINNKKWRRVIKGDVFTEGWKAFIVDELHRVKKW